MKKVLFLSLLLAVTLSVNAQHDVVHIDGLTICVESSRMDPCYSYFEIFPGHFCPKDTVTARAVVVSGAGPYTYHWSNGANTETVKLVPSNTVQLNCTVTDATGCQVVNSQPITSIMRPGTSVSISQIGEPCYKIFVANTPNCNDVFWSNGHIGPVVEVMSGTQFIAVITENEYGCQARDTMSVSQIPCPKDTFTQTLTVIEKIYVDTCMGGSGPKPVANFIVTNNEGCGPLQVQFFDASSNNPTSWSWSFPGGTPSSSTEQNPMIEYKHKGTFPVSLVASNANGPSPVFQAPGIVHVTGEAPVISASASRYVISPGEWTILSVSITGNSNYAIQWDHASTLDWPNHQNPIATPSVTTTYQVTVTDIVTGCMSVGFVTVTVLGTTASQELDPSKVTVSSNEGAVRVTTLFDQYRVSLVDVAGREVKTQLCTQAESIISTADLASGYYVVRIFADNKMCVKPIVVLH